ncbi:MAG: hypothetical protein JWN13_110 [Betaproteobacteria bacterium]|jgi:hypothetical protein|nr:hypothetical protein [Betaproteobacteria bacterium]
MFRIEGGQRQHLQSAPSMQPLFSEYKISGTSLAYRDPQLSIPAVRTMGTVQGIM